MAADSAPALRVARVEFKQDGRLEKSMLEACDVARIVTEAIERRPAGRGSTIELVIRIDRVSKATGSVGVFGGTDVSLTLLSAGGRELNQPFFCRADTGHGFRHLHHCARVEYCGDRIAEQISGWLSWQAPN
jgi:hypothetical protein